MGGGRGGRGGGGGGWRKGRRGKGKEGGISLLAPVLVSVLSRMT